MNQIGFEIKIIRQHWIHDDGKADKEDLCSHGEIYIRIGAEVLSTEESGSWTLSATGLYLLRSLTQDCEFDQFSNQLVPCCGHFLIPNERGENYVVISGCPRGIDWRIKHKDEEVIFESKKGTKGKMSFEEYRKRIIDLTNEIEIFYGNPKDKIVPEDEFDKNGFNQFWAEWKELKNKWE